VHKSSLSKGIINLNKFKFNLGIDPKIFPREPQIPWKKVPIATRCD
jgi:hypothetical protein